MPRTPALIAAALAFLVAAAAPAASPGHRPTIAVVGDSLSVGLAAALPSVAHGWRVDGYGIGSTGMQGQLGVDWIDRARTVAATAPDVVVVMIGMNDSGGPLPRDYLQRLEALTYELRGSRVIFMGVPETLEARRNRVIGEINSNLEVTARWWADEYMPTPDVDRRLRLADGVHYTPGGYTALARAVVAEIGR